MTTVTSTPVSSPRKSRADTISERLIKDESIVATAVITSAIYWKAIAVFIIALLVAVFIVMELGVLLAVVSVLMAVHAIIRKEILLLVVTTKRIMVRYGIMQVEVVDIHFDKVESIELERMLPGYVLGYASVIIMGTGNRFIVIPYVENAVEIRRAFNEMTLNRSSEGPPVPVVVVAEQPQG